MTNKLVVGSLPFDITEEELHTVFSTYGEVANVQVLGEDKATGLRQAHVFYRETKAAEDAIQVLNDIYKIRTDAERPIQVWWAPQDGSDGPGGGGEWGAPQRESTGSWGPAGGAGASDASGGGQAAGCGGGAGAGSKPPEDSHKLFVGGLPEDITEDELRTVFGTYGEVVHVHIMKPNSMTGLRGAFVFYSKREAGEDAIKVLNDAYKIRTDAAAPIQVRWGKDGKGEGKGTAEEMNKLFVGSLPTDITEDELKTVFSTYGEINTVHLMAPHAKTGMRAALVFYARRESGEDAIKVLNEVYKFREDAEQPIQVKWGKDKEAPWGQKGGNWGGGKGGGWNDGGWGGGKAGGWGGSGGGGGQGWQALGNAGGGGWQDRAGGSRSGSWGAAPGGWSGGGDGGWQQDRQGGGGGWNDGWKDSSGGWGGGGKGWGGSDGGWGKGGKGGDKGKGCDKGGDKGGKGKGGDKGGWCKGFDIAEPSGKLFVANLPEDIQNNALEYVFGTYGKVQKVHIMSNNSRNGAIAAFVEFGTTEEAETAIASLNEKYEIRPGYGPILVRHANARRPRPY